MRIKICKKCGIGKSLDEFYQHFNMADNHLSFCKECVKQRIHEYWAKNSERLRIKEKIRFQKRKKNKHEMRRRKGYLKQWRTPIKQKAHNSTHRKLHRPSECAVCGKLCKPVGHHPDYSQPLKVIWCCFVCHRQIHSKERSNK